MPFIRLKSGEEILVEVDDIPEPPASIFTNNPYEASSPMFKRWRAVKKATYSRACYYAIKKAKDKEHFLSIVGTAREVLNDPTRWEEWKSNQGIEEFKRPMGRPPLTDEEKVERKIGIKRSDLMKELLEKNGVNITADNYLVGFDKIRFQPNGRLFFEIENLKMSVHQFLQEYV